jgi:hypothetical protein
MSSSGRFYLEAVPASGIKIFSDSTQPPAVDLDNRLNKRSIKLLQRKIGHFSSPKHRRYDNGRR